MSIFDDIEKALPFCEQFGIWLAKSGMMSFPNEESGKIIAFELLVRGLSVGQFTARYQIVFGKLAMKTDAQLAAFREAGGKHKIVNHDSEKASIELTDSSGHSKTFKITHDEVKQEPFYRKNDKYKTPFSRKQMLWARVVSMAIRATAPEVTSGSYTPEEHQDIALEDGKPLAMTAEAIADLQSERNGITESIPEIAEERKAIKDDSLASTEQVMEMTLMMSKCFPKEKLQTAILNANKNRNHESFDDWSSQEAEEFTQKLNTLFEQQNKDYPSK